MRSLSRSCSRSACSRRGAPAPRANPDNRNPQTRKTQGGGACPHRHYLLPRAPAPSTLGLRMHQGPPLPGPRKPLTQKSPRPGPRAYVHETGDAGKRIRRGGAGDHRRGKPLTQNSPRPSRTEAGETRARRHYEPQAQVPYKGNHTKADKHMNGGPGPPSVCKGNV